MATMKNKSVGFNMDDPAERDLYAWCDSKENFSKYVNQLISRDKKRSSSETGSNQQVLTNLQTPGSAKSFKQK